MNFFCFTPLGFSNERNSRRSKDLEATLGSGGSQQHCLYHSGGIGWMFWVNSLTQMALTQMAYQQVATQQPLLFGKGRDDKKNDDLQRSQSTMLPMDWLWKKLLGSPFSNTHSQRHSKGQLMPTPSDATSLTIKVQDRRASKTHAA